MFSRLSGPAREGGVSLFFTQPDPLDLSIAPRFLFIVQSVANLMHLMSSFVLCTAGPSRHWVFGQKAAMNHIYTCSLFKV